MKKLLFVYSIFLLVSLLLGCERSDLLLDKQAANSASFKPISINEAQNYVGRIERNARKASSSEIAYVWDNAKQSTLKDGKPIIIVPINYNGGTRISLINKEPVSGGDKGNYLISDKVILYKDESDNIQAQLLTVIPDKEYRTKKMERFKAVILRAI